MSKRELLSRFKKFDKELEKTPEYVTGLLGIPLGGNKLVEVPTRNGYVFVRLRDSQDELIQAFNDKVSPVYDLPVIVQYKDGHYIIIGRDTNRYGDWGDFSSYLPRHGSTHSFAEDGLSGGDVVWVYQKQFMPYLAQPSGTAGSGNVILNGNTFLKFDGTWRYDGQTGSANLLGNKPTGSSAVMVLIYEDMENGIYNYSVGSPFSASITGTAAIVPYIPSIINPNYNPVAAIRLVSGTSTIQWDNIYDARQFFRMWATGTFVTATGPTGPAGAEGATGSIGPQGPAGASGAGNPGLMVWNEGVPLNTGTVFDFVGANVDASISGSVVRVFVTGSSGGGGGMTLIQEITPSGLRTGTFSGIPSTYSALKIVFAGRTNLNADADNLLMFANQDYTATHYRNTMGFAYGASADGGGGAANSTVATLTSATAPTGSFGYGTIDIPYYTETDFNRSAYVVGSSRRDTSSLFLWAYHLGWEWFYTDAINRLDLVANLGTQFYSGTVFRLYGIS